MIDPAVWREGPSERRRFGVTVTRHAATIHYGRNLLRIRWTGPWTR